MKPSEKFCLDVGESNSSTSSAFLMEQNFLFYLVILNTEIVVHRQNCMLRKVEMAFW